MYVLGVRDFPKVAVRVDGVVQVPYREGSPEECLHVLVTLRFSLKPIEVRVLLFAPLELEYLFSPEDDFHDREVGLDGFSAPDEDENPYARGSVAIETIWFGNPSATLNDSSPALVLSRIDDEHDPRLSQFGEVPPLTRTQRDM